MSDQNPRKPDKDPSGNPWMKSLFIWAGILLALILFVQIVDGGGSRGAAAGAMPYSRVPQPGRRGLGQGGVDRQGGDLRQADQRRGVQDQFHPRSAADRAAPREGRRLPGRARAADLGVADPALPVAALPPHPRNRLLHHAPDAEERRLRGDGLRAVQGQIADREIGAGDVRRRRRDRRIARGIAGDRRLFEGPDQVRPARRQDPQGRASGRRSGHRQDASGAGRRRRGQRALLHHLGLGLRRDVRRRRREPGARHVRAGQEERALHRLHRRDRRGRAASRRRARQRQ